MNGIKWGIPGAANIVRRMSIPAIHRSANGRAVAVAALAARAQAAAVELERVTAG